MADITVNVLTSGFSETDASSYPSASVSPAADKVILAVVSNRRSPTSVIPTASGAGITWVQVFSEVLTFGGGENRITVFRGIDAAPSTGAITFDFGGQTQLRGSWAILELDNVDTGGADGADAIVQADSDENAAATSVSVTLAGFGDANNATIGFCSADNPSVGGPYSPGSGWPAFVVNELTGSQFNAVAVEFRTDNSVTVDFSSNSTDGLTIIGIELKNATPTPAPGPSVLGPPSFIAGNLIT